MGLHEDYMLLGLRDGASMPEVKSRYRRLAWLRHPDRNPDDVQRATQMFREVADAYRRIVAAEVREVTHPQPPQQTMRSRFVDFAQRITEQQRREDASRPAPPAWPEVGFSVSPRVVASTPPRRAIRDYADAGAEILDVGRYREFIARTVRESATMLESSYQQWLQLTRSLAKEDAADPLRIWARFFPEGEQPSEPQAYEQLLTLTKHSGRLEEVLLLSRLTFNVLTTQLSASSDSIFSLGMALASARNHAEMFELAAWATFLSRTADPHWEEQQLCGIAEQLAALEPRTGLGGLINVIVEARSSIRPQLSIEDEQRRYLIAGMKPPDVRRDLPVLLGNVLGELPRLDSMVVVLQALPSLMPLYHEQRVELLLGRVGQALREGVGVDQLRVLLDLETCIHQQLRMGGPQLALQATIFDGLRGELETFLAAAGRPDKNDEGAFDPADVLLDTAEYLGADATHYRGDRNDVAGAIREWRDAIEHAAPIVAKHRELVRAASACLTELKRTKGKQLYSLPMLEIQLPAAAHLEAGLVAKSLTRVDPKQYLEELRSLFAGYRTSSYFGTRGTVPSTEVQHAVYAQLRSIRQRTRRESGRMPRRVDVDDARDLLQLLAEHLLPSELTGVRAAAAAE